jgi:hypothetical protein
MSQNTTDRSFQKTYGCRDYSIFPHLNEIDFEELVIERQRLRSIETQACSRRKEVDVLIGAALETVQTPSVRVPNKDPEGEPWIVSVKISTGRKTLNKDKLKIELVSRGVAPMVIGEAFEEATRVGKPSVIVAIQEQK